MKIPMKSTIKKRLLVGAIVPLAAILILSYSINRTRQWTVCTSDQPWPCGMQATGNTNVFVTTPYPAGAAISSPIMVAGSAKAALFKDDKLQVTVVDWDGRIIGESMVHRISKDEPHSLFEGNVSFTAPVCAANQDYCHRGWIIFGKSYELLVSFK